MWVEGVYLGRVGVKWEEEVLVTSNKVYVYIYNWRLYKFQSNQDWLKDLNFWKGRVAGVNWEIGIDIYTLIYKIDGLPRGYSDKESTC